MRSNCAKSLLVFSCYILVICGQKAIVPHKVCKTTYHVDLLYKTNITTNDSIFIQAEDFSSILLSFNETANKCNHTELKFSVEREMREVRMRYTITASIKDSYLYNYSIITSFSEQWIDKMYNCMISVDGLVLDFLLKKADPKALALNISGHLLIPKVIPENSPNYCDDLNAICPDGSAKASDVCECSAGTHLNKTVSNLKCTPCPENHYQEESGMFECKPCPLGTTTFGSTSRTICSQECLPGTQADKNLTKCVPCPKNEYQEKSGESKCKPCPSGTMTFGKIGSISRTNCLKECSPGTRVDVNLTKCVPCPENEFQENSGKSKCEPCPSGTTTSGKIGSVSRTNCTAVMVTTAIVPKGKGNTLAIAVSVSVVILFILVVIIIAVVVLRHRRRKGLFERIFRANFEEFPNPYFQADANDEEYMIERCSNLGPLHSEVHARNLEIPSDCIKFTGVKLGRGNFGEVHQVLVKKQDKPEELCAAKMAREGGKVTLKDMLDELDIHLKLEKNPNIVNLVGVCSTRDEPFYLIVEFCDNGCLNDFLRDHKENSYYVNEEARPGLTLEWRLQRTLEICNGMKYLASQKIVHRDLAARNILLDHNEVAKVSDFGMAKDVYVKSYYKQRQEGSFPLRWMSMEAIEDLSFNEKTDVWSYGILMWEIFTDGKLPYYSIINDEKVAKFILSGKKLTRPSTCPKYMYRIMLECWCDNAYNRPRFRELYEELEQIIKKRAVQHLDESRPSRGLFKRRFNETKRSLSRKLSWRRHSRHSQTSTASDDSVAEPRHFLRTKSRNGSLDFEKVNNAHKLDDVCEVDGTLDVTLDRKDEEKKKILTDDKNLEEDVQNQDEVSKAKESEKNMEDQKGPIDDSHQTSEKNSLKDLDGGDKERMKFDNELGEDCKESNVLSVPTVDEKLKLNYKESESSTASHQEIIRSTSQKNISSHQGSENNSKSDGDMFGMSNKGLAVDINMEDNGKTCSE